MSADEIPNISLLSPQPCVCDKCGQRPGLRLQLYLMMSPLQISQNTVAPVMSSNISSIVETGSHSCTSFALHMSTHSLGSFLPCTTTNGDTHDVGTFTLPYIHLFFIHLFLYTEWYSTNRLDHRFYSVVYVKP